MKTRSRNEALDCTVYALAALKLLSPDFEALANSMFFLPRTETETVAAPVVTEQTNSGWIPKIDDWLKR